MSKKWYEIKSMAKGGAEIVIYDEIGAYGVNAKDFMADLKEHGDATDITLRINSPGGSVFDGMAIYNQIKQHKAQVTVYIDGLAASMASVIAMAGDLVVMPENAMMMIHNPWTLAIGDAEQLRNDAELLDKIKNTMVGAYASRTGLSEDEISSIMNEETWLTGAEAVQMGFADEAYEALDIAACVKDFNLKKFGNPPEFLTPSAVADTNQEKESEMTDKTSATYTVDNAKAIDDAVKTAMGKETERRQAIVESFGDFAGKHGELLNKCLLDSSVTVADAQAKLLKAMGENEAPIGGSIKVETARERFKADAEQAILARAGIGKADPRNPLRGHKLEMLARQALDLGGVSHAGLDSRTIVGAAFTQTTSDFSVLLENTMHKVLQSAYETQADTWSRFCATGSVSDFRAHNRYRTGSIGNLDALNEAGEYKNKAIPDGEKSSITASTKGNTINLTRETIINDDLGALVNLGQSLGRSARRTIEADVYALLAENSGLGPTMSDGDTLFHANHGNIGGGAALAVAAIEADRVLMASQMDVSGNDYLDLRPEVLLVPIGLGGTARVINDAQYDPDTANKLQKPNMVRGLFNDIVDTPRLSGTRRYMFANPSEAPVIEVAFLNGEQSPFLDSEQGFTTDGVRWKVRIDYGLAAIDYRGAVTDAGA